MKIVIIFAMLFFVIAFAVILPILSFATSVFLKVIAMCCIVAGAAFVVSRLHK